MKNAEMTYGALSAKIRALYGKRLRADDFARLAGLKNEAELLEALRQHPGWSGWRKRQIKMPWIPSLRNA